MMEPDHRHAAARIADLEDAVARVSARRWRDRRHLDSLVGQLAEIQRHLRHMLDAQRDARSTAARLPAGRRAPRAPMVDADGDRRLRELIGRGNELMSMVGQQDATDLAATMLARDAAGRDRPGRRDEGFAAFLRSSYLDPLRPVPFSPEDDAAVEVMQALRAKLSERYAARASVGLVSVVMPTYNRMASLPRAVRSVLDQSYQDWELLVIDDGSSDGTDRFVSDQTDPRVRYLPQSGNAGVSRARNVALAEARGDWIAYLDSDNHWDEDFLSVLVHRSAEEGATIAYCGQWIWQTEGAVGDPDRPRKLDGIRFGPFNRSLMENRNAVDLNAVLHTRRLVDEVGGFNEDLPRLVDWELLLRYTAAARPLAVPCLLSHYEVGAVGDQLTRTHAVRPSTKRLDEQTLQARPCELTLPADVAQRAVATPLHALMERPPAAAAGATVLIANPEDLSRLRVCLEALAGAGDVVARVLLVDGLELVGTAALTSGLPVERVAVATAGSFAAAMAAIGERIGDEDVVLLSAGAVVTPGWWDGLAEAAAALPDAGLVAPRRTVVPGMTIVDDTQLPYHKRYRELDMAVTTRTVVDPMLEPVLGLVEVSRVEPSCVLLPREVVAELGLPGHGGSPRRALAIHGDLVRHLLGRRLVYTPRSNVYDLG
ncbi:MAG: glycosyltransferase family 2 protein [Egibacteraceae bacterium]